MPKPLNEFTVADWLHLRPILHNYKHARFLLKYEILLRKPALGGDIEKIVHAASGKKLLTTVTFNDPAKALLQVRAIKHFVPDCVHLLADNSDDMALARKIEAIAEEHGAYYMHAPEVPWRGLHAGLSHGFAMTWVWRHIVKKAAPYAFGFIDHDIYPTAPDDPFAALADHSIAGRIRHHPPRWYLWPGFCFYRFDAVSNLRLNFIRDWLGALDTGGGNWKPLYRHVDSAQVHETKLRYAPILPGIEIDDCRVEWLGTWLHESNDWRHLKGPQERDFMKEKSAVVAEKINALLAQ